MFKTFTQKNHQTLTVFAVQSLLGSMILALSAQIVVPLPLVPITGQTLGVVIVAYFMGAKAGVSSVVLYLLEGLAGFPVFAELRAGLPVLLGTSGGYLFGFVPAVAVMGFLFQKTNTKNVFVNFSIATLGQAIAMACGLAQLSLFVPSESLLVVGLYPFIAGTVVKSVLATIAIKATK